MVKNYYIMVKKENNGGFAGRWIALTLCLGFLCVSCATKPEAYKDIDNAVNKSDFEAGVEAIVKSQESGKPIYNARNAISLYLDKGLLEHYAGKNRDSSGSLQEAERLIEEAFTKSVTADIASYIANDNTKEYPGEDFEDIYLNVFNALNYYNNGDIDGALVEIRKLTMSSGKLNMLERKYEDADSKTSSGAMIELRNIGFTSSPDLPKAKPVEFSDSALARYLSALFYLAEGKPDDARIEFEQLEAAYNSSKNIYGNPIPKAVAEARAVPAGKARLNIIGFTGLSPIKEEGVFNQIFPFFQNEVLWYPEFKLPVLVERPSRIDRIEVAVGHEKFNLELLEDMGAVIEETYNARFSRTFMKTYIRTLLKYAAVDIAATEARRRSEDPLVTLAAVASAFAVKKAFDATESADIRMSRYLPDKAYVGGINLDPGNYNVIVHYYAGNSVIAKEEHNVNIRANTLNLVEVVNLR
uniref:Uncharacterized protein n=1 Tax=uncultured bacterium contig00063 TaxID=1181546 RepID=A0A806KCJ9_9BACT|nr:hypothetical protein [uncultured bacterium contig00063]